MPGIMSGSYARDQADHYLQQVEAFGITADQNTISMIAPPDDMSGLGYTPYTPAVYRGGVKHLTEAEARATFAQTLVAARNAALSGAYPRAAQLLQQATDALHLNGIQLRGVDRIEINRVKALFPPKMQEQLGLSDLGSLDLGIPGLSESGSWSNILVLGAGIGFGIYLMTRRG